MPPLPFDKLWDYGTTLDDPSQWKDQPLGSSLKSYYVECYSNPYEHEDDSVAFNVWNPCINHCKRSELSPIMEFTSLPSISSSMMYAVGLRMIPNATLSDRTRFIISTITVTSSAILIQVNRPMLKVLLANASTTTTKLPHIHTHSVRQIALVISFFHQKRMSSYTMPQLYLRSLRRLTW